MGAAAMSTHREEVFHKLTIAEPLTPAMVVLLIVFAVVFALQIAVPPFREFALDYLALDTGAFLAKGRLWEAVTSMFLHGSVCHFVSNMAFFWFFGSLLANSWRQREFLAFFFACGVVGSLCFHVLGSLAYEAPQKGLGASGAVTGIMVGCALACGERIVLAFFLIPMKLRYFVAFCLAIDILVLIGTTSLAQAAHLGGAACGAAYLKFVWWRQRHLAGAARGTAKARSRIDGLEFMDDGRR